MLRVAHETHRVALRHRFAVDLHHHTVASCDVSSPQSVPQRVERCATVVHGEASEGIRCGVVVQRDGHAFDVIADGRFRAPLFRSRREECLFVAFLVCQHDIFIRSRCEVEVHVIAVRFEGRGGSWRDGLREFLDERPVGITAVCLLIFAFIDIHVDCSHVVGEHIGALQVVVVTEIEVESLRTGRQVLFHHRAGSEHASHKEACREFMYQISERHGHLFVFNNRCGILQVAVCILRVVHFFCRLTASVVSQYFVWRRHLTALSLRRCLVCPASVGIVGLCVGVRWAIPTETRCCYSYIYNVQLMLTEERRKIPVPSREWLGTGYRFLLIARED